MGIIQKLLKVSSQDTDLCQLMNKKSNHQTENGNTFYLLQNPMKPSHSKFHQGKLTNRRISFGHCGIRRQKNSFYNLHLKYRKMRRGVVALVEGLDHLVCHLP